MDPRFLRHASRDLPRYTSYPTAVRFGPTVQREDARRWAAAIAPDEPISIYVHVPFCEQLCWYCGCHTSVPNGYRRIEALARRLEAEAALWAEALGPHAGAAHLHFGGGSPNALSAEDFERLAGTLKRVFRLRAGAEFAVELDPRALRPDFLEAMRRVGVTRASLGVQTLDPAVQAKVNRIQPYDLIARAAEGLRAAGVGGINFDLMYGLPAQTPESVAETARLAAGLGPDRVAVFGYAHVPWFKKHQAMIREEELADVAGRWAQADAADAELKAAGYLAVGLDHYARVGDPLVAAVREGRLRRNFQGYTTDPARVLVPLGPSAIGGFAEGFVQNAKATNHWSEAVDAGRLAIERGLALEPEDRLRAGVIERIMCDGAVDVGALCRAAGAPEGALDDAVRAAHALQRDGLCRVEGRRVRVAPGAERLVRVVAACFDAQLSQAAGRHARAV